MKKSRFVWLICLFLWIAFTAPSETVVETIDSKLFDLVDMEGKSIVILWSSAACTRCREELSACLQDFTFSPNVSIVGLARMPKSALSRRECAMRMSEMYQDSLQVYYDLVEGRDSYPPKDLKGGLFGKYKVLRTPALLLIDKENRIEYVSYDSLFSEVDISKSGREKVRFFMNPN